MSSYLIVRDGEHSLGVCEMVRQRKTVYLVCEKCENDF